MLHNRAAKTFAFRPGFSDWHRNCWKILAISMDIDKINAAIRAGLNHCRGAESIITALAAFLAGLTAAGWSRDEVRAVEIGMLKVLNGVATVKMSRDKTIVGAA